MLPLEAHAALPALAQIAATQLLALTSEHAAPIAAAVDGKTWKQPLAPLDGFTADGELASPAM